MYEGAFFFAGSTGTRFPKVAGPMVRGDDRVTSGRSPWVDEPACCCGAPPFVQVVLPPSPTHPKPGDLLLCAHHYRTSSRRLASVGAAIYDRDNHLIASG